MGCFWYGLGAIGVEVIIGFVGIFGGFVKVFKSF